MLSKINQRKTNIILSIICRLSIFKEGHEHKRGLFGEGEPAGSEWGRKRRNMLKV
jgi:hypothetical protein